VTAVKETFFEVFEFFVEAGVLEGEIGCDRVVCKKEGSDLRSFGGGCG
jgi:hypothetical protein